jgi:hypothetical protein
MLLCGRFFPGAAIAAFSHNGLVEPISEVFRKLVNLVIAVNFDGFFGGIHHDMAFVAPMQMLVQFNSQVFGDPAVQIIGQLL